MKGKMKLTPGEAKKDAEEWLDAAVLLARRPLDANPDAKHPGKAREESAGESKLSPSDFPRLSMGQKPSNFS